MSENEPNKEIVEFFAKLQKIIDLLDLIEDNCIICEKKTHRHIAIFGDSKDGSDLGFGSPEKGFRYGIAPLCEEHNLQDDDISRQVRTKAPINSEGM